MIPLRKNGMTSHPSHDYPRNPITTEYDIYTGPELMLLERPQYKGKRSIEKPDVKTSKVLESMASYLMDGIAYLFFFCCCCERSIIV